MKRRRCLQIISWNFKSMKRITTNRKKTFQKKENINNHQEGRSKKEEKRELKR
jgi:hypothetical protein